MALYGFKKFACENIRTGAVVVTADPAEGHYTINGRNVKTIPAGSIINIDGTEDNVKIKYVSEVGAHELVSSDIGETTESVYALLAEDYSIGDKKAVYYIVENKSNLEVR